MNTAHMRVFQLSPCLHDQSLLDSVKTNQLDRFIVCGVKVYHYFISFIDFVNQYPWCTPYLWAAIVVERLYLVSDWYCWATLGTERWITRQKIDYKSDVVATDES